MAWLAQTAGVVAMMVQSTEYLSFITGSNYLFICMAKDVTSDVAEFNDIVKTQKNPDRDELMERFCDIIQLYSDAKQ